MAKSSRSSITKTNRSRLKSKVFGPAEDARTKRLSEKLAQLASQPKAAVTSNMDIEKEQDITKSPQESKEDSGHTDGASRSSSLSIPIPEAILDAKSYQLPLTPPPTPPTPALQNTFPSPTNHVDNYFQAEELLFYHTLGVATDIKGFDNFGNLILEFDSASRNGAG